MVWEFNCLTDLPAEYKFASAPESCTRLANGNTIFASWGKGGQCPRLIEVTRDKRVVWVLQDWKDIGDAPPCRFWTIPEFLKIPGSRNTHGPRCPRAGCEARRHRPE